MSQVQFNCNALGLPPHPPGPPPFATQTATYHEMIVLRGNWVYFWNSDYYGNLMMYVTGADQYRVYGCVLFRDQSGRLFYQTTPILMNTITNWRMVSSTGDTFFDDRCKCCKYRRPDGSTHTEVVDYGQNCPPMNGMTYTGFDWCVCY